MKKQQVKGRKPKLVATESQSKELVIAKKSNAILSKAQKQFNQLVKKSQSLQDDFNRTEEELNRLLNFYSQHLYPEEREINQQKLEILREVYAYYNSWNKLSKKEAEGVKYFLKELLDTLMGLFDPPTEEMKVIYEKLYGANFDDIAQEQLGEMLSNMKEMFEQEGFDLNVEGINAKMSEKELFAKLFELNGHVMERMEQERAQQAEKKETRKKTKKQQEKDDRIKQMEEAKNKNINTLYKQLAMLFHPDLEQDQEKRTEKEALMKELTVAYENKDLHTLLRLEMNFLSQEGSHLSELADSKLNVYNEVLKEQISDMQHKIRSLIHHPRYKVLENYLDPLDSLLDFDGNMVEHTLKDEREFNKQTLAALSGVDRHKEMKKIGKKSYEQYSQKAFFSEMDDDLLHILEQMFK